MNSIRSVKYSSVPEKIERRSFIDIGDTESFKIFRSIEKVQKDSSHRITEDVRTDGKNKRTIRDPLEIDELVLVLADRMKKKEAPGRLYKSTIED